MESTANMTEETSKSILKNQHELDLVSLRVDNVLKGKSDKVVERKYRQKFYEFQYYSLS